MNKNKVAIVILLFLTASIQSNYAQEIKVVPIGKQALSKLIKERHGKILFLNLWATWCVPCREEYPSIVKLAGEFKDVDFAGISADYPDEIDSKIIPFLKSNKVNFINYVSGFSGDEALINALDKKWNGALPATFIYNKYGKKIAFLNGEQSYERFKEKLNEVIKEN